jgi:hypothetical protein
MRWRSRVLLCFSSSSVLETGVRYREIHLHAGFAGGT